MEINSNNNILLTSLLHLLDTENAANMVNTTAEEPSLAQFNSMNARGHRLENKNSRYATNSNLQPNAKHNQSSNTNLMNRKQ